jgi:sn-glycerol 3-phosphate transport system ATP-binding protein
MSTFELQGISKKIHDKIILHPMDVALEKGEFVAIVGPSGSGKSTLLRIVAGLDEPTSGEIRLNGQSMSQLPPGKRDIAMVFQDYALYPHMTVYDNMAYGLKMRKFKPAEIRSRVERVAIRLGLTDYLLKKPATLSGGQQQRVAMGRALVRTPSLFLFDEPLSNLDVSLRAQLRVEIKQLHQASHITSLYVTHDQMEAMTLATRILVLNKGRVEQFDTPRALYSKPINLFVATFLGLHPMNLLAGCVDNAGKNIKIHDSLSIPLPNVSHQLTEGEQVFIGMRPEEMSVAYEDEPASLGLEVQEVFVDDMGSDLLVRVCSEATATPFLVRLPAKEKQNRKVKKIRLACFQGHLFIASSGMRIGGWDGEEKS